MHTNLQTLFDHSSSNLPSKLNSGGSSELPFELREAVDNALNECFGKTYSTDELLGDDLTQVRGPLDSLCKRHGLLLEEAIAYAFAAQGERYDVVTQVSVIVSNEAMALVEANLSKNLEGLNLPAASTKGKRVVIDVLVFDFETGDLHVISVKRGGGAQGGKAARDARKDLTAAGLMLKHLMLAQGYPIQNVKKVLVDWYGRSGIIARKTVTRETVDGYFGIPVASIVEAMSARLASGLAERMAPRLLNAFGVSGSDVASWKRDIRARNRTEEIEAYDSSNNNRLTDRPSLSNCLSALPMRKQGRQMRHVVT
ncbi:MAG: hypothetical protein ABJN92_02290 [Roseibium sp.]|uniref:hypothetical protein n=1 Tax=Roseibium sp. TaxID=1936156 RepID=UPI003298A1FC